VTRVTPRRRSLPLAAACASLALALGGCGISLQTLPKLSNVHGATYPIHAQFSNVLNLPINAQVRTGAQVIGEVGAISTHDFVADVTLDIKKKVTVVQGTVAQVRFDNPLGDEYVLLTAPPRAASAPSLPAGSVIPEDLTSTAPSVEDTFGALSLLLNGGGINQLEVIIHELNNSFNGNQPQIRQLLSTINTAVTTLSNGHVPVDNALDAIEHLTQTLNGANGSGAATISNGIASIAPALGILASENTSLDQLISSLSGLGAAGTKIAETSTADSVTDLKELLPVVNELTGVSQQLTPDLTTLSRFEDDTPRIIPGDYLQASIVANVILPSGDFTPSPGTADGPASASGAEAVSELLGSGAL
jgi:phospholipid/cholesterol/gamma-HCH transport system substrate-binding protein